MWGESWSMSRCEEPQPRTLDEQMDGKVKVALWQIEKRLKMMMMVKKMKEWG